MKCDICGTTENIAGVAASPLGPISFCYCKKCLKENAEPEWMLEYMYSEVGREGEGLHEGINELKTFKDSEYWTWERWKAWRKENPPETKGQGHEG